MTSNVFLSNHFSFSKLFFVTDLNRYVLNTYRQSILTIGMITQMKTLAISSASGNLIMIGSQEIPIGSNYREQFFLEIKIK